MSDNTPPPIQDDPPQPVEVPSPPSQPEQPQPIVASHPTRPAGAGRRPLFRH